jgi:hypothetical protein
MTAPPMLRHTRFLVELSVRDWRIAWRRSAGGQRSADQQIVRRQRGSS